MKKIGIYVCGNVSKKCSGNGCTKAVNNNTGSFSNYDKSDYEVVLSSSCNGCNEEPLGYLLDKIEEFKGNGVNTIHLSTCIRGKCDYYQEFVNELSKHFDVIGYTHGSAEGKKNNNINKKKVTPIGE